MNLSDMIAACIERKTGDKDFALFYLAHDGAWQADIGNDCHAVMLGEIGGEFSADGKTPEAAVAALIAKLEAA